MPARIFIDGWLLRFACALSWAIVLNAMLVGCGGKPPPRTLADIERDRANLPALFLTEQSRREVLAPATKGDLIYDSGSGENAWLAYYCENPDCPGKHKGENGRPFLFVWRDPRKHATPDGTIVVDVEPGRDESHAAFMARLGGHLTPTCPECLALRDLKSETPEQSHKYAEWAKAYQLPEAVQRRKELDAEVAAWKASIAERRDRKSKPPEN